MKVHVDQNCLKVLAKFRKVIKLGRKGSDKTRDRLMFREILGEIDGQLSENLKINRKPWEIDFGLVLQKKGFRQILGKRLE